MQHDQKPFVAVGDIQMSHLAPLMDVAPEGIGEIAFSIAVDRTRLSHSGILDSIRPIMTPVPTPDILRNAVAHEPDELSSEMPTVNTFAPASREFTITFVRFPDEAETDAYVVISGRVLHTRNAGRRPFALFTRLG